MEHTPALTPKKRPAPGLFWLAGAAAAVLASGVLVYAWRVFYSLDARGWPALPLFCAGAALALALVGAAWLISRLGSLPARAAGCILAVGVLFCFANPPMQAPDEYNHYLRSYSISQGHLNFDADRQYPEDVCWLYQAFPGAWVSAHTSQGLTQDEGGNTVAYSTEGYALKQRGEDGPVESVLDSFREYLAAEEEPEAVGEPILFMVLPFLPQALGMLLARLLGFGALGCLYGGRLVNLCVYAFLCYKALGFCRRGRGVLLALTLNPLSLYMAASLSYDAHLLGCYYLCASFLGKEEFTRRDAAWFMGAFLLMNVAKPYINLLWLLLIFFLPGSSLRRRQFWLRRGGFALAGLVLALVVTWFTSWYGVAMRQNYGEIGRMLGEDVQQLPQLLFVLKNPLRYLAVFLGTLYENNFFLGQLGLFGALDLPVDFLNLASPLVLALAAALCCGQGLGKRQGIGALLFALLYLAGAATAMYITYTPVGMVRIIGLQARYFLPVFLMLFWLLSALLGRALAPAAGEQRRENICLVLCGCFGAVGAILLFQHYFVGPVYLIP